MSVSNNRFGKRLLAAALAVALVPLLSLAAYSLYRVQRLDGGICMAVDRALSTEEHRQALLRNLVRLAMENSRTHDEYLGGQKLKTGVIRNPPRYDFPALMEAFSHNDRSFEANFSIEPIAPRRPGFDPRSLHEPYVLVSYRKDDSGSASLLDTRRVERLDPVATAKLDYSPSLYERFRGFGRHFYRVSYTFLDTDCCDSAHAGEPHPDYLARKRREYWEWRESFDRGLVDHQWSVAASNCGEVLTEEDETGAGTRDARRLF
ncbi:hypothetical protein ACSC9U_09315 [Pseudomonas solani]|nr:hypothetical protein [Pseudomonas solani]